MNKDSAQQIISKALQEERNTLSEYESKQVLAAYQIPVTREALVKKRSELAVAARSIGYPLVMKGVSTEIVHKTEKNLVHLDIRSEDEAFQVFDELTSAMKGPDGSVLLQEKVLGKRELVVGLIRDPQFGPCVMFGLGGIFTEFLEDVTFRKAPLDQHDAFEMMQEIRGNKILEAIRGMEAADIDALARILMNVGTMGLELHAISEIDINPVILAGSKPVAVDALVILYRA